MKTYSVFGLITDSKQEGSSKYEVRQPENVRLSGQSQQRGAKKAAKGKKRRGIVGVAPQGASTSVQQSRSPSQPYSVHCLYPNELAADAINTFPRHRRSPYISMTARHGHCNPTAALHSVNAADVLCHTSPARESQQGSGFRVSLIACIPFI